MLSPKVKKILEKEGLQRPETPLIAFIVYLNYCCWEEKQRRNIFSYHRGTYWKKTLSLQKPQTLSLRWALGVQKGYSVQGRKGGGGKSFPNCYITAFLSQNNELWLMVKTAVSNSVSYYGATCQNCPIAVILPKIKINTSGRISVVNFFLGFMTQL